MSGDDVTTIGPSTGQEATEGETANTVNLDVLNNLITEQETKIKALETKVHLLMREHYIKAETTFECPIGDPENEDTIVLKLQNGEMNLYKNEVLRMCGAQINDLTDDAVTLIGKGVDSDSITIKKTDSDTWKEVKDVLQYLQIVDQRVREIIELYKLSWHQVFVFHRIFEVIENNKEYVTIKDFYQAIKQSGTDIQFRTVMTLVEAMEFENPERLSQLEFIELMARCAAQVKIEKKWQILFDEIDVERTGQIEQYEIIKVFEKLGEATEKSDVDTMLDDLEIDVQNGKINFNTFKRLLLS